MKYWWIGIVAWLVGPVFGQNQPTSLSNQSTTLADSLFFIGQWKEAIPRYENAIRSGNKTPASEFRLGYSFQQLGNYPAAKPFYRSALLKNPPNPVLRNILVNLAKVYGYAGQLDSCKLYLDLAMQQGYSNVQDLEKSPEFALLRSAPVYTSIYDSIQIRAYPCKGTAEARWFDFWVGEWEVYVTGTTNLAGHSKIEKIAGDCAILENWTSAAGNFNGKSINFYNTLTSVWEQHWVGSAGGYQKFDHGAYKDGVMRFDFIRTNADGSQSLGKFSFFNQGQNQVRQFSESSNDQGKTWSSDYDFTYKRVQGQ